MEQTVEWFVGVDWATEVHQVCVIDQHGRMRWEREVPHTVRDVQAFTEWLVDHTGATPGEMGIAIETPRGALIDTLIERGFQVFAINPKQLDRFRDRFTVAGAKDDRLDALVLGSALRTDAHAFRPVRVDDARIVQLRELSRLDGDLQCDLSRLTNRLREQIYRIHPALLALCPAADAPWFWVLVEHALTPDARARLSIRKIKTILKTHRIRRITADEVQTNVIAATFYTAPGIVEAAQVHIESWLERVRVVHAQRRRCGSHMEDVLEQLRMAEPADGEPATPQDIEILESLPGIGRRVAATILTEASRPLADRHHAVLRSYMGIAPVTQRSGKGRPFVRMRRACNDRLRQAAYHWGRVSIQRDPTSRAYYDRLRARGHSHGRALRTLVDRWLRILMAMLRQRTLYDPMRYCSQSKVGKVSTESSS